MQATKFLRATLPLAALFALAGCSAANFSEAATSSHAVHGSAYGGQQPVANATVALYTVGTGGDGSASRSLLTSPVTTDANGNFNITGLYSCTNATEVYLTVTGGNPSPSVTNPNLALMAALGSCASLSASTFIEVNEVTTVAAVSALAPFMTSRTAIASGSTASQTATLAADFTLASQLTNIATGTPPGTNVPSGMTVPVSLIDTVGDILAACINSAGGAAGDGSACGTLFSLALPSTGPAPTDTITAMLNIANHPTANTTSLFALVTPTAPFQPTLPAAPSSFQVGLQPQSTAVTRTFYNFPEADNTVTPLYNFVNSAQHTIDMTMYELVDTTFSADLVAACGRGVTVRVILDQNLEKSSNTAAYNQLNATPHCSAVWANPTYHATHQKTITIDGSQTAILSLNLTSRYYSTTRDYALIENDPADIAAIEATFNQDYISAAYTPGNGDDLIWSPTTARSALLAMINNATATLMVENEEMSAPDIVAALEAACSRGVTVHIAMTDDGSYHSEYTALEAAGCGVHTYVDNSTTLYIHGKAIVADFGTAAQTAYMGSINFSTDSLIENRELGLYISDPAIMTTLNNIIAGDYAGASAYSPT